MRKKYSYTEAIDEIQSRIGYRCRASAIATKSGVSRSMLSEVLSGRKIASSEMMAKLGYSEVRYFVRNKQGGQGR